MPVRPARLGDVSRTRRWCLPGWPASALARCSSAPCRGSPSSMLGCFTLGFTFAGVIVPAQTLIQRETPHALIGRISSTMMSMIFFAQLVGLVLSGILAQRARRARRVLPVRGAGVGPDGGRPAAALDRSPRRRHLAASDGTNPLWSIRVRRAGRRAVARGPARAPAAPAVATARAADGAAGRARHSRRDPAGALGGRHLRRFRAEPELLRRAPAIGAA